MATRKPKKSGRTRANGQGSTWLDPKSKQLYAVITWTERVQGKPKRRRRMRAVRNKTQALEILPILKAEVEKERQEGVASDPDPDASLFSPSTLTWQTLAAWYQKHYLGEAILNSDRQVIAGCLSWKQSRRQLRRLVERFGPTNLVRDLTSEDLRNYREARLREPVVKVRNKKDPITNRPLTDAAGRKFKETILTERTFASPHRELAMIRQLLNHAFDKGWITRNPWRKHLIDIGKEKKRDTIATQLEEQTLLEQCSTDKQRRHLWLYLTVMFDSACRSAELRRLLVSDCDFTIDQFTVFSFKGGMRRERPIPMTPRARVALLDACHGKAPGDHVFTYDVKKKHADGTTSIEHRPLKSAPKRSFATAKRLAKWLSDGQVNLDKFRGHDIRHTTITRLVNSNKIAEANIMKITGHNQMATFLRYVNPDHAERNTVANVLANYSEADVVPFKAKKKRKETA